MSTSAHYESPGDRRVDVDQTRPTPVVPAALPGIVDAYSVSGAAYREGRNRYSRTRLPQTENVSLNFARITYDILAASDCD